MAGLKLLEAKGVSRSLLPQVACDCSGYVCWALGVHREGHPGIGSLNTDAMVADAAGARRLLVPLAIDKAVPGALLVHPWPGGASKAPGHVAIVTEVGANGRPTRMLHCAPGNILVDPPEGLTRSAIAETGTQMFDENRTTVLLMWKAFVPSRPRPA